MIGVGSLVRAFFFLSYRPLAQCWSRGDPFLLVCLIFFRPTDPPTQSGATVWVIGPLNRGTGGFSCSFFFFVLPTPSSAPSRGGGQGNLATHTVVQDCMFCLLIFVMHVVLFSFWICVFG